MQLQKHKSHFADGWRHGKELVRDNARGAFRLGSLFVANVLGVGAGLMLAIVMNIPVATEDRALTLFLLGVVNGWLLCLLYGVITGKARRRRKRRRIK